MATFNPNLPANSSPISSAELRDQFTSLKTLYDGIQGWVLSETAGSMYMVDNLDLTVSNPPTQAQVQQIVQKLNELMEALRRN